MPGVSNLSIPLGWMTAAEPVCQSDQVHRLALHTGAGAQDESSLGAACPWPALRTVYSAHVLAMYTVCGSSTQCQSGVCVAGSMPCTAHTLAPALHATWSMRRLLPQILYVVCGASTRCVLHVATTVRSLYTLALALRTSLWAWCGPAPDPVCMAGLAQMLPWHHRLDSRAT